MPGDLKKLEKHPIRYLKENLGIALGLVLIWRGIWLALDAIDYYFLGGTHWISALVGIILGILVIYLPHHNLRALERL